MLTELRTKSQITIPKDIVMKMGLREGDKLEIRFGSRTVCVEVLSVTEQKGKENAVFMYKEL